MGNNNAARSLQERSASMIDADKFDTFSDIFNQDPRTSSSIESEDQAVIKRLVGYLSEWCSINPLVFGRILQGVFTDVKGYNLGELVFKIPGNKEKYLEGIRGILNPLFINSLKMKMREIEAIQDSSKRAQAAKQYHGELAGTGFLDPACEGGSCLTELYLEIRDAEDSLIAMEGHRIDLDHDVKIELSNFCGLDLSQANVNITTVMLYIAEEQAMNRSYERFKAYCVLPHFKPFTNIIQVEKLQRLGGVCKESVTSLKGVKIINHPKLSEISCS